MSELSDIDFAANEALRTGIAQQVLDPCEFEILKASLIPWVSCQLPPEDDQGPALAIAGYDKDGLLRTSLCRLRI